MAAFCLCGIGQTLFYNNATSHEILLTLLEEKRNVSLGPFSPANTVLFFSLSSQAEGRTLPGIRELSPRSKYPQETSSVGSKMLSTVAAHLEREGKCCIAI